jgi:hypothetical protein
LSLDVGVREWQEKLEKKKAEYAEKMRNQAAAIHKEAEEKRASVEARRCEEIRESVQRDHAQQVPRLLLVVAGQVQSCCS